MKVLKLPFLPETKPLIKAAIPPHPNMIDIINALLNSEAPNLSSKMKAVNVLIIRNVPARIIWAIISAIKGPVMKASFFMFLLFLPFGFVVSTTTSFLIESASGLYLICFFPSNRLTVKIGKNTAPAIPNISEVVLQPNQLLREIETIGVMIEPKVPKIRLILKARLRSAPNS